MFKTEPSQEVNGLTLLENNILWLLESAYYELVINFQLNFF